MKIAYLILAHDDPAHLRRLIGAIHEDWTQIFVHIDRKAKLGAFTSVIGPAMATFIPDRVTACWGGFSLVQATLNLMMAARNASPAPDWYVLLSGADYPIRGNNKIYGHLKGSDREHITLTEMPTPDGRKPLSRLERLHFEGSRGRPMPRRVLLNQTNLLLEKFYKRNYRRVLGDIKPYAGSQWWALSWEAVDHILNFVRANPRLMRFYRHSLIPDEMFFHTILGNSPLREKAARNFTYADWSRGLSRNPALLTQEHLVFFADPAFQLDDVEGSGPCFFARKFTSRDSDLLDRVDEFRADADERVYARTRQSPRRSCGAALPIQEQARTECKKIP